MRIKKFAKLFAAGEYPDKGVTVTAEDLQRIAAGFSEIPIKVEHTDTVFDDHIGSVTAVFADQGNLYGSLEIEADLWPVIERMDAKKLSVGIRPDLGALTEVSIVKQPRVADARVFCFSADANFSDTYEGIKTALGKALAEGNWLVDFTDTDAIYRDGKDQLWRVGYKVDDAGAVQLGSPRKVRIEYIDDEAPDTQIPYSKEKGMDKTNELQSQNEALRNELEELKKQNEALRFSAREGAVDARIEAMLAAGKITPAGKELAKAIMLQGSEAVTFAGNKESVADLFCKFVDTMPKAPEGGKLKVLPNDEGGKEEGSVAFSADELKVLKGLGADPERIAKTMNKE